MSEDALRTELIDRLADHEPRIVVTDNGVKIVSEHVIDHLLPTVRREIEQARADERERLADAILANKTLIKPEHEIGCPACTGAESAASYIRALSGGQ